MPKKKLYEEFIARMKKALEGGSPLEASWYAYAVLEDRLRSLLRSTGGETSGDKPGKLIKMMGPKVKELLRRAQTNDKLKVNFEHVRLNRWTQSRNELMHAMAEGQKSIEAIDAEAEQLAETGVALAREYSAAARRMKRHKGKV